MKYCYRCGMQNNMNALYCANCGNKLNYVQQPKKHKDILKNNISLLSYVFFFGFIGLYIFFGCIYEAGESNSVYSGLTIIFGTPIGFMMCSIIPFISGLIGLANIKKKRLLLTIIQIFVLCYSVVAVYDFRKQFLPNTNSTIYLAIYVVATIGFSIFILYETLRDIKENNN